MRAVDAVTVATCSGCLFYFLRFVVKFNIAVCVRKSRSTPSRQLGIVWTTICRNRNSYRPSYSMTYSLSGMQKTPRRLGQRFSFPLQRLQRQMRASKPITICYTPFRHSALHGLAFGQCSVQRPLQYIIASAGARAAILACRKS